MFNLARHFQKAVQPLVSRALDLHPAERRAWLTELHADCPNVAQELERLMRPALDSSSAGDRDVSVRDVVPGSLEDLGLRC